MAAPVKKNHIMTADMFRLIHERNQNNILFISYPNIVFAKLL